MTLGLLVALENANKVLSDIQRIFNTGPYGDPPLKIKILKSGFLHAREDQKIGPEPKIHAPRSSYGKGYGGQPKRGQFLTLDHMGTPPLKIKILKIGLRSALKWP